MTSDDRNEALDPRRNRDQPARTAGLSRARTGEASYAPAVVEILTSRMLLRPTDLGRSLRFYEQTVGLAIYREWGSGSSRGVVFFLGGGGLLELSAGGGRPASDAVSLVLQVRDVHATREHMVHSGVTVQEEPELKPWGLLEMTVHDPDGLALIFVEVPPGHPRRGG